MWPVREPLWDLCTQMALGSQRCRETGLFPLVVRASQRFLETLGSETLKANQKNGVWVEEGECTFVFSCCVILRHHQLNVLK